MVVDEAHFIKNLTSQRSKHVLSLSRSIRATSPRGAVHGTHGHAADQPDRRLPRHLAVPRLDRRKEAAARPSWTSWKTPVLRPPTSASSPRHARPSSTWASCDARRWMSRPTSLRAESPTSRSSSTTTSVAPFARPRPPSPLDWSTATSVASPCGSREDPFTDVRQGAPHPRRRARGARGVEVGQDRRERLHHGAQDRPGQGRPRRRLHRPAGSQRGQGGVLRQAHRRHGHRGGALRQGRSRHRLDPWRPDAEGAPGRDRRVRQGSRRSRSSSPR